MTIFQIILVIAASIFIGIPLYLFFGKRVGREAGAIMVGVFDALFYWDPKRFQKTYDEVVDFEITKIIWPFTIIVFVFFSAITSVVRLGWLAYLAIKAGAKFYWKILKYCWE